MEQIERRLAELETQRNANYWAARSGKSMHGYKPLPRAFYEERERLQKRLRELTR